MVSCRNISLGTWARLVIERHGSRFATHHVFGFLVFNIHVKSRNRNVSMLGVTGKNFPEVERVVRSLNAKRLETARAEAEASGSTCDEDARQLLGSLSLYGFRQPMSRESRLSMRRKIKSLTVRFGMPAIWFTLNPNDIIKDLMSATIRQRVFAVNRRSREQLLLPNIQITLKATNNTPDRSPAGRGHSVGAGRVQHVLFLKLMTLK